MHYLNFSIFLLVFSSLLPVLAHVHEVGLFYKMIQNKLPQKTGIKKGFTSIRGKKWN